MRNLSTTSELLIELNRFRVANGKKPLKTWKESKEKAVYTIKQEAELAKSNVPPTVTVDEMIKGTVEKIIEETTEPEEMVEIEETPVEDITPEEFLANTSEAPPEIDPLKKAMDEKLSETPELKETFTIVELAIELKISPKVARAKLRRTDDLPPKTGTGWTFANDVKDAIIKALA